MIRRIFVIFCILLFSVYLFSNEITAAYAEKIAINFLIDKSPAGLITKDHFPSAESSSKYKDGILVYYLVEVQDYGFIIISADDDCYPVLAYGYTILDGDEEIPVACLERLDWYADQIIEVKNKKLDGGEDIQKIWTHYSSTKSPQALKIKDEGVAPLISSNWGQKYYYNAACPVDPDGPGGHAIAGCVATAMAQVMFYYRYPVHGDGASGYMSDYGYEYVDFEEAEYKWDEMVNAISGAPNPEIAELTYHAGVSVEMNYGPSASGTQTIDAVDALRTYFKYKPNLNYISFYDLGSDFRDSLYANLDQSRVILYRGGDMGSGHAFVCDGYQDTSFFHFNWGWNGNYNGYYLFENLNPGVYNFTYNQEAIINIYPATDYPEYCQGNTTLEASRGTFADGSGPETYQSNSSCSWLISPAEAGITNIQLWFTQFQTTEAEDKVLIYDGPTTSHPVIGAFSGDELPPLLVSSGAELLVVFESTSGMAGQGWAAEYLAYSGPFCNGYTQFTNLSKTFFTDGSGSYHYIDNSDCSWLIKPQEEGVDSVGQVHLYFHWSTLATGDTLYIYDGGNETAPLIAKMFGTELPDTIHSTTDQLFLKFISDDVLNADGWAAGYSSSLPVYCKDTLYYTEKDAVIEDGSGDYIYVPYADCYWLIETENTEQITFDFLEFDLEYGYDQLMFYDASVNPPALFGTYWGHETPPMVKMFTDRVLIRFTTDESMEYGGWKIHYSALAPGIAESNYNNPVVLLPNPARTKISIQGIDDDFALEVYDAKMSLLDGQYFNVSHQNKLNYKVEFLDPGIYFILFKTERHQYIKKLIIH